MGDSPPSSSIGSFCSGISSSPTLIDSAPFLPNTSYLDSAPTVSCSSDGLLSVQIRILELLRLQAADSFTALRLAALTRDINPSGTPDPQEALRLCYYMRQLGIATYSRLGEKRFRCYLANPDYMTRNDINDVCYWKQEYKGTVTLREPVASRPRHARRNALQGFSDAMLNVLSLGPSGGFADELDEEDEDAQLAAAIQSSLEDAIGSRGLTGSGEASSSGAGVSPAVTSGSLQVPVQQYQEPRATMPPVSQQAREEPPPPPGLNQEPSASSSGASHSIRFNRVSLLVPARVAQVQRPEGHTHPRPSSLRPGRAGEADDPHALVHQISSVLSQSFVADTTPSPIPDPSGPSGPSGSQPGQRSSSEPASASTSRPAPSPLSVAAGELIPPSTSTSSSHIQHQNTPFPTLSGCGAHQTSASIFGRVSGHGRGSGAFSAQTRFGEGVHTSFHSQFSGGVNAVVTQTQNSGSRSGLQAASVEMASHGGRGRDRGASEAEASGPSNPAGRGGRGTRRWDVMQNPHSVSRGGCWDGGRGAREGA